MKTAIIIKGNPKLVDGNERADGFYNQLKTFLEGLGFSVALDKGEPHTVPPPANLWLGHSRGYDRLRFAPKGTIVVGIGVPESVGGNLFPVVSHPKDELAHQIYKNGKIIKGENTRHLDDTYHYVLTEDMKKEILEILKRGGLS